MRRIREKKLKIKRKLDDSFFITNRVYLFIAFIALSLADMALGVYYVIFSLLLLFVKTLKAELPIKVNKEFKKESYVYKITKERELKLDLWYPNNQTGPSPLIYFCHGGGWISGFRDQPNNISWCKYLADKGYIVASIDYRYGYLNNMEDILTDYIDGLNYLRENHKDLDIDIDNITLMGLSAGGHLSLLYACYFTSLRDQGDNEFMDGIRSIVAYYSPSNLSDILIDRDKTENKSLFAHFAIKKTLQGSPTEIKDVYDYYSPESYLTKAMIPTLLVHGKKDKTVPFTSSVNFAKELHQLDVPYEFLVHKNADHSFDTKLKDYATINILRETVDFIKKYSSR